MGRGRKKKRAQPDLFDWFESSWYFAQRNTWELEYPLLRIPVEIINSARGGKVFSMPRKRLQEILGLSDDHTSRLSDCGLILPPPEKTPKRPIIDYPGLAHTYRQKMRRVRS